MVFCYHSDREKLLKFEVEDQELNFFFRSLKQFIQTVKGRNNFWLQNAFFNLFLISNKFEQLEFKLEKKYWDLEKCRKS